jgi:hypothetical protein
VVANVMLPTLDANRPVATLDGQVATGALSHHWLTLTNVGSGQHTVRLGPNF